MPKQAIPIRLPDDLELDLRVYSEVHHGAPLSRIVADALREFISGRLASEPAMRQRFEAFRRKRTPDTPNLRVVGGESDDG